MQQEKIDRSPFFANQHVYLGKFLEKMGESDIFSVCIKDIENHQVRLHNACCGKFWGFSEGAMEGMTARAILTGVPNFVNVENELANIEKHEKTAIQNRRQSIFTQVLLSYDGFVQIRQSSITPLNGISNRLIGTAGIGLDLTRYTNPLHLLDYYRYYYPKRVEAVTKFSTYFQLDTYFYRLLSYEELRALLSMGRDYRHKQIAENLKVSPKTVANYLSSIRDKLRPPFEIHTVLRALRSQQQWHTEDIYSNDFKSWFSGFKRDR
jgi:predicted DNA-binding protein (UPF0251 family)